MIRQNYLENMTKVNLFYLGLVREIAPIMQYSFPSLAVSEEVVRIKTKIDLLYTSYINCSKGMIKNKGEYITPYTIKLEEMTKKMCGVYMDSGYSKKLDKNLNKSMPIGLRATIFDKQIEMTSHCIKITEELKKMWCKRVNRVKSGKVLSILPYQILLDISKIIDSYLENLYNQNKLEQIKIKVEPKIFEDLSSYLVGENCFTSLKEKINNYINNSEICHNLPIIYDFCYRYYVATQENYISEG